MRWLCLILPGAYLLLCAASLVVLFVSTEPLVGIYAVFLAWPWDFVFELVGSGSFAVNVALVVAAFLVNAMLLYAACRLVGALFRRLLS